MSLPSYNSRTSITLELCGEIVTKHDIPERVKNFIFLYIDSVELIEILLLFHNDTSKSWSAESLARELRSNANSTSQRIYHLRSLNILRENSSLHSEYFYSPHDSDLHEVITELANAYRIQRHNIFELIFSPMKKARDLANAFRKRDGNKEGKQDE